MYVHWRVRDYWGWEEPDRAPYTLIAELAQSERVGGKVHRKTICQLGSIGCDVVQPTTEEWRKWTRWVGGNVSHARVQFWVRALGTVAAYVPDGANQQTVLAALETRVPFPSADEARAYADLRHFWQGGIGEHMYALTERTERLAERERQGWGLLVKRLAASADRGNIAR